jgi:hypothetical protein
MTTWEGGRGHWCLLELGGRCGEGRIAHRQQRRAAAASSSGTQRWHAAVARSGGGQHPQAAWAAGAQLLIASSCHTPHRDVRRSDLHAPERRELVPPQAAVHLQMCMLQGEADGPAAGAPRRQWRQRGGRMARVPADDVRAGFFPHAPVAGGRGGRPGAAALGARPTSFNFSPVTGCREFRNSDVKTCTGSARRQQR